MKYISANVRHGDSETPLAESDYQNVLLIQGFGDGAKRRGDRIGQFNAKESAACPMKCEQTVRH